MDIIRSIVLILFLFSTQNYFIMFSLGMNIIICKKSERTALLSFKQHLKDPYDSLSSWSGENCCRWAGVVCNNRTHHVVQLHFNRFFLGGEPNPSLQGLKQLSHLDLSMNEFEGISIPADFVGSLQNLRYLDLSHSGFSGMIPHQLGNLSNLRFLDLSGSLPDEHLTGAGNFQWLSHLSSMEYLDLRGVNLKNASNCLHAISMLPSLLTLSLSYCALHALPSLSYVNFTSLTVLDLSRNQLNSTLPEWLYSLTKLEQLELSSNSFQGPLPYELGRLRNLNNLVLRNNSFSGSIPLSIGRLSLLKELDLDNNKLNGSLPESLGNLSKLVTLTLSLNAFEGVVSDVHFANLSNLQYLSMGSLVLKMSPEWVPPFQLLDADLRTCRLGPGFPIWLRTQKNLTRLDLSRTGISGTIPTWFWNLTSGVFSFDLSHNGLNGGLPKVLNASSIILRSNQFNGQLPLVTPNVYELDLSNNSFSGPISTFLCNPNSEMKNLEFLDLSDNLLSGDLSDCWVNWIYLIALRLRGNKITGKIPSSIDSILELQVLHLSNNRLSGELPSSLRNCTLLYSIDLGENEFTGILPIWLGESLSGLQYLRLRSNKFYGEIPLQLCHLASIQVLDIAHNDLRGSIPRCFNNFSVLTTKEHYWMISTNSFGEFVEKTPLVVKGRELDYYSIARALVTSLDLSNNSLSGEIPEELTSLHGLILLNLSDNCFTGKIPENIGNMGLLESIDISNNSISGVIPQSISRLNFLSYLNLSYNNLSGKIPLSTQLQHLTELSFIGNQELCGLPLKHCNGEKPSDGDKEVEDEIWFEMKWFYMSMGVGFAVGFWAFWGGVIVLKRSWRVAYFRFLDDMKDKLCLLF